STHFTSQLAVAYNKNGSLELYAIDDKQQLDHIWQDKPNNGWGNWATGLIGDAVWGAFVVVRINRLELVGARAKKDSKDRVHIRGQNSLGSWWMNGQWLAEKEFTGTPVIILNADSRWEIFARDGSGAVF